MALGTGTRLGRYEILGPIGAGGMGAVYRARDTSLGREVAIKVLLDEFTADTDRVRRFEREAKATAALNHPNLLAVYDIGTHDGLTFIVSELLEGRTLREVMAAGPVSPKRAARYAAQVADGLAAAHAKGIVHRDLKPANLFVTRDDRVKILDFGLARVVAAALDDQGSSLTTETSLTAAGTVLGSAGYMSPEQVRGAAIDHRADIFALGCVLYEMLAARRAFHRDTVAGTLAAIVESDPPTWSGDGSIASQRLIRIARRCLEKNPDQRFQSARDLGHVLSDESLEESEAVPVKAEPTRWRAAALAAGVVAIIAMAFGAWAWQWPDRTVTDAADSAVALEVTLPVGVRQVGAPVLSHDGRQLVVIGRQGETNALFVRALSSLAIQRLAGTEGAVHPFFSPKGDRLGFFSGSTLKTMALDGSPPAVVCQAGNPRGGTWTDDGWIVFAADADGPLSRVRATGGDPEPMTTLKAGEEGHRWPLALPGASGVVFVAQTADGSSDVVAQATSSQDHVILQKRALAPRYGDGWLFFVNGEEELQAAAFDVGSLTIQSPAVPQPERFSIGVNQGDFAYGVSRSGTMAFVPFASQENSLNVVEPGGQLRTIPGPARPFDAPRASPDGARIAVTIRPKLSPGDVWVGDFSGGFLPLTRDGRSRSPVWNARGDWVAVESQRAGLRAQVFLHSTDGRNTRRLPTKAEGALYPLSWLSDDTMLIGAYNMPGRPNIDELQLFLPAKTTAERLPLPITRSVYGRVSPDGKLLAYTTNESGQYEVYVTSFPQPGHVWPVSKAGFGREPVWAKSGRDLYFLRRDGSVMVANVAQDGKPSEPRSAGVGKFPTSPRGAGSPWWDTLPGGRFVVTVAVSTPTPASISVIVNRAASLASK